MRGRLKFVPFQEAPSPPMTPALRAACERAIHVILPQGRILRAGRASLYVLSQIGFPISAAVGRVPPFVWLVELGYRAVASHRPFFARFMFTKED